MPILPISSLPSGSTLNNENQLVVVQSGVTNQIQFSNFNQIDFNNVVNLGTGNTASVLTLDGHSGTTFVFTDNFSGSGLFFSAQTQNFVEGRMYCIILQKQGTNVNQISNLTNNADNSFNLIRISTGGSPFTASQVCFFIYFRNLLWNFYTAAPTSGNQLSTLLY
jgi:hypothetical protein